MQLGHVGQGAESVLIACGMLQLLDPFLLQESVLTRLKQACNRLPLQRSWGSGTGSGQEKQDGDATNHW